MTIYLQDKPPSREIAQAVKVQFYPNINTTSRDIRNKIRPFLQQKQPLPANVKAEVRTLHENLDNQTRQMRQEIGQQLWNRVADGQQRVREAIENAGGTVHAQISLSNNIGARLPAAAVNQIAGLPEVERIGLDTPPPPALNGSAQVISASSFWNAGYDGDEYDIGVVEHGVDNHPYLRSGASLVKRRSNAASNHGTSVAGIVAMTPYTNSEGEHNTNSEGEHKGIAYGLDKIIDASFYPWSYTDAKNAMTWAVTGASDDAEVINYSFGGILGGDPVSDDTTMDLGDPDYHQNHGEFLDNLIDTHDVLVVKAAGNETNMFANPPKLDYSLSWGSDSYNAIIVGAATGDANPNRATTVILSNSSRGPTPAGRKKPDVVAPGSGITTTTWPGGGFGAFGDTSAATPHVSGALLLFWDHELWHPALLKALLINSAEDKGPAGWDKEWGWGYIDLDAALDQYDYVMVGSIETGNEKWYSGTMNAGETVTLVWLKHDGLSLANLDLYLYDAATSGYIGVSASGIDNVEQIELNSGTNRSVYIKVVHQSGGSSSETFGLAPPSNFQSISPPFAPAAVSLADEESGATLYNNYPNPFNPETWIPYRLASETTVVIRIYNTGGQLVRTLNLGKQLPGRYVAQNKAAFWDGRNEEGSLVASGVYFYTLEINGEKTESRKMILQK